jgi:hypothetical protein
MSFSLLAETSLAEFNPSQTKRAHSFTKGLKSLRLNCMNAMMLQRWSVIKALHSRHQTFLHIIKCWRILAKTRIRSFCIKEVVEMAASLAHDSKRIRRKHVRAAIRSEAELCELLSVESVE